jgi:hypothetical protein
MAIPAHPSLALRIFLLLVDISFLVYWFVTAAGLLPAESLYANYDDPVMVSWNWSFLPLDLFISATGLAGLWMARRGDARWRLMVVLSLGFTVASGANAIAFWALQRYFDMGWWAPNLVLLLGPLPFLWQLLRAPELAAHKVAS